MFCTNCGLKIDDCFSFCPGCGNKIVVHNVADENCNEPINAPQKFLIEDFIRAYFIPAAPYSKLYFRGDIPVKKLTNAIKTFAPLVNPNEVIALCDFSLFDNGKSGILFTEKYAISHEIGVKKHIVYETIVKAEPSNSQVALYLNDGSSPQVFPIGCKTEAGIILLNEIGKFFNSDKTCVSVQNEVINTDNTLVQESNNESNDKVIDENESSEFWVVDYINKYFLLTEISSRLYFKGNIPEKKLYNAIRAYAPLVNPNSVIALYDNALFENAKNGLLFLEDSVISNELGVKKQIYYNKIIKAEQDNNSVKLYTVDSSAPDVFIIGCKTETAVALLNAIANKLNVNVIENGILNNTESENITNCVIERNDSDFPTENKREKPSSVNSVEVSEVPQKDDKSVEENSQSEAVSLAESVQQNEIVDEPVVNSNEKESATEELDESIDVVLPKPNGHRVTDNFSEEDRIEIYKTAKKIPYLYTAESYSGYKLDKAVASFATGVDTKSILFCADYSLLQNFKRGIIFTDSKMIYKSFSQKLEVEYKNFAKINCYKDNITVVSFSSGGNFRIENDEGFLNSNAEILNEFLLLMKNLYKKYELSSAEKPKTFSDNLKSIVEVYRYSLSNAEVSSIGNINLDKFNNAKRKYAENAIYNQCLVLVDNSFFGSAKCGIMITIWGIYSYNNGKNICVLFNDIESLEASKNRIVFTLKNGTKVTVESEIINEKSLGKLIKRILSFFADYKNNHSNYSTENDEFDYLSFLTFNDKDIEKLSLDEIKLQHKNGNPFASLELARRYVNGIKVDKNVYEAIRIYENTRYAVAYRMLGELYFAGEHIEKNLSTAEKYFLRAIELGDMASNVSIANMYFLGLNHSVDYERAFGIYKAQVTKVSEDKLPESLKHNIAICYKYGYGCAADYKLAEKWFDSIKDTSDSAKHMLADMYINFVGFDDKKEIAIKYFDELVEKRYIPAITQYGTLKFEGKLLEQDFDYAEKLLAIACSENDPEACYQYSLLKIYTCENGNVPVEAFENMKKAADSNHINAERDLGVMYQFGIGTRKNIYEAKLSYEKAAAHGDKYAANWKDYTKKFLNEISVLNHICDDESDNYADDCVQLRKIKNPDKLEAINGFGLNSFVTAYPSNEMMRYNSEEHIDIKRRLNSVEKIISDTGLTQHSMFMAGAVWQNFTKFDQIKGAHGHAMEYAAHIDDLLKFKRAIWKGGDNETHGADRVSGYFKQRDIQSKCYNDANAAYRDTFPNDQALYLSKNGEPMIIEVNSDIYDKYYNRVKETHGKEFADKYVKDSGLTKKQCENIAKFGNVDSLKYSLGEGLIAGRNAFLISSAVSFAVAMYNGSDTDEALGQAVNAGVKSMGIAFVSATLTSQLMKTNFVKNINVSSKLTNNSGVQKVLGKATSQARGASSGAVTAKTAGNMIKSAAVSGAATTLVLSSADIARVISGRMSKEQLAVNVTSTAAGVAAGSVGYYVGAACGSVIPVVGTVIGGFIGGAIATAAAESVVRSGMTSILGDDNQEMLEIFNGQLAEVSKDYMLAEDELEYLIDEIKSSSLLTDSGLRDIFAADNREGFCYKNITPIVEELCQLRNFVVLPDEEKYVEYIVLNDDDIESVLNDNAVN